ncbi:MAG: hypothetical protein EPN62_00885 [Candidimonas sp.]|nr:MAG: hypothetical protein EPN77_01885 [Candidimonas sp.]TAM26884.1 MAG: hypothetical protein EPN62_00885 [Candidimonas sp.]
MTETAEAAPSEFPAWVEMEMWNWSRWCWDGPWPHPLPSTVCASMEHRYVPVHLGTDEPPARKTPINHERALVVESVYKKLPLAEQRVLQAEYPRRHEYDEYNYRFELIRNVRAKVAPRKIGITPFYYQLALERALNLVMRAFQAKGTT